MKNKWHGVAEIELRDAKTGKVEKKIEHNTLTCLLDDLFTNGQMDSALNYNYVLKNYFNKLVLLDRTPNKSSDVFDDDCNIICVKSPTAIGTYDETGIELVFDFAEDEAVGLIDCLALAHKDFQDYTLTEDGYSDLLYKNVSYYKTDGNSQSIFLDIDFENGWIWSIEADDFANLKSGNEFNVYIKKYYHDFKQIPFAQYDKFNMKLLESTTVDVSYLITDCNEAWNDTFLNYAYDEYNGRIFIIFINNNTKAFNVAVISRDEPANIQMQNMTLPTELTSRLFYANSGRMSQMPYYDNRLALFAQISDDQGVRMGFFGMNPYDSTDYDEYEMNYLETINYDHAEPQLTGMKNGTAICDHVMIKDHMATVLSERRYFGAGTFHKSKIIYVSTNNDTTNFEYRLSNQVLSTINELTKTIYKKDTQTLRITYRISQGD